MNFEVVRRIWDLAAGFQSESGEGFTQTVFPPPALDADGAEAQERALRQTERAQPAIATAGMAATALLGQLGLTPVRVAGHSLGEITALAAAGVFDMDTLIATAAARGRAMAAATVGQPGAMTAVLASRDLVDEILRAHGAGVVVANHNAPEQTVISGEYAAIERVEAALAAAGVDYRRLPVAAAFHSPSLGEAAASLEQFLTDRCLHPPTVPVYSHVTAAPYTSDVAALPAQVGRAIVSPVRFIEQVEALYRDGARVFIEPGPDNVLTRLVGECLKNRTHVAVAVDRRGVHGVTSLWRALGALAAAGVPLDLAALWESQVISDHQVRPKDSTTVLICGANFGKRYPPRLEDGETIAERPAAVAKTPTPPPQPPRRAPVAAEQPRTLPAPATPIAKTATGNGANKAWLDAFSLLQQQTAAAHGDFQRLLAERHAAFLAASSEGLRQLAALAGAGSLDGELLEAAAPAIARTTTAGIDTGEIMSSPSVGAAGPQAPTPVSGLDAGRGLPPSREASADHRSLGEGGQTPASTQLPSAVPSQSPSELLLDIVAEKTGYPREALDLTMDLETDLGIDSIKRVEILAAANQRLPDLPRLQAEKLGAMRTLAQIAAYIDHPISVVGAPTAAPVNVTRPAILKSEVAPAASIERRVITFRDVATPGVAVIDLWDGEPVYVVGDHGGIGRALAARLSAEGIGAEVSEILSPAARRIVIICSPSADSIEAALAINRRMLSLVASRAGVWEREGGLLVTVEHGASAGAQSNIAWLGGVSPVCRTARLELPQLTTKAISLGGAFTSSDVMARVIATELISGGTEPEVVLSADGRRRRPTPETRSLVPGDLPLDRGSIVVVSAGARGITAETIVALAQHIELRFLVLGRTQIADEPDVFRGVADTADLSRLVFQQARARGEALGPTEVRTAVAGIIAGREATRTLTRLREARSEVRYVATDIADGRAVASAVDSARRDWGPITGIVHGAGVVADAWLRDKTESHVDRVFAPKLLGLANLLAATAGDPLRLICAFSSVAAHVGNTGQADYAMANRILEQVIAAEAVRRGPSCQVRALAWGPWETGMVTPHLREKFADAGVSLIDVQAGGAAFVRELASRGAETTVLLAPRAAERPADDPGTREHSGAALGFGSAVAHEHQS